MRNESDTIPYNAETLAEKIQSLFSNVLGTLQQSINTLESNLTNDLAWKYVGSTNNAQFQNAWSSSSDQGNYGALRYAKDNLGNLHIRGWINGSAATNTTIFQLPSGYIPKTAADSIIRKEQPVELSPLIIDEDGNVLIADENDGSAPFGNYSINAIIRLD